MKREFHGSLNQHEKSPVQGRDIEQHFILGGLIMASLYKKPVKVTDPETGVRKTVKSKKWYGRYRDADGTEHRVPLATDKRIAQQMLNDILNRVEREKSGIVDEVIEKAKIPLSRHFEDFRQHLLAKNDSPLHVKNTINMIAYVATTRKWRDTRSLNASELEAFVNYIRKERNLSLERCNHYIRAVKSFSRWMVDNDRLERDPFRRIKTFNTATDQRHKRRPLSADEFSLMVDAARTGPSCEGIPGRDRVMLYYIAAWTGFRKGELGSLTVRHLCLDASVPYLTVSASYSKRRRNDTQFLHPGLVDLIRKWLEKKNPKPDEILFPISKETCGVDRNTAEMIAYDLNAARSFWIAESSTPEEEQQRLESDFLKYKDSQGKFADFHGLRHTFITNLSLNGVDPKTAQTLARHSTMELTMNVYSHLNDKKQIEAINLLPSPSLNALAPNKEQAKPDTQGSEV